MVREATYPNKREYYFNDTLTHAQSLFLSFYLSLCFCFFSVPRLKRFVLPWVELVEPSESTGFFCFCFVSSVCECVYARVYAGVRVFWILFFTRSLRSWIHVPLETPLGRVSDIGRGRVPEGREVMNVLVAVVLKEQSARAGLRDIEKLLVVLLVDGVAARAATHRRIAAAVRVGMRPVHTGGHRQVLGLGLLGQIHGNTGQIQRYRHRGAHHWTG